MKTEDGLPIVTSFTLDQFIEEVECDISDPQQLIQSIRDQNIGVLGYISGISAVVPWMKDEVSTLLFATYELLRRKAASDIALDKRTIHLEYETSEGMPKIALSTIDVTARDLKRYVPPEETEQLFEILRQENPIIAQYIEDSISQFECFQKENNARAMKALAGGFYEILKRQARTNTLKKQMSTT